MCRLNSCGGNYDNGYGGGLNSPLARHMREFIGESVIVFTEGGGASGCGFEGILLAVNNNFIRIRSVNNGFATPSSPLSETICGSFVDGGDFGRTGFEAQNYSGGGRHDKCCRNFGAITDIPVNQIVAFTHNAV